LSHPDFALVNNDADASVSDDDELSEKLDDIFHMIEIEQLDELPFMRGDVNQDGAVNLLDVGPFIGLLSTGMYQLEADINAPVKDEHARKFPRIKSRLDRLALSSSFLCWSEYRLERRLPPPQTYKKRIDSTKSLYSQLTLKTFLLDRTLERR